MNKEAHKTDLRNSTKSELFYPFVSNIAEVESRAESLRALPRCSNVAYCNGKEKDYESGFHYYGARYYWSELLTGWLSVDPMMDKYPGISPYNYCMWNPVKLVDPDGNNAMDNDDWYQNKETGAVLWREGHARETTRDGDVYENIGESYSKRIVDGVYENYYQNCLLTIGKKRDAAKLAYEDKSFRTRLIKRTSSLPDCHKRDLFNSHVASRGVYPYQPTSEGHALGINATFCGIIGLNLHGGIYICNEGMGLYGGVNYCTGVEAALGLEYTYIPKGQILSGENHLFCGGYILSGTFNTMSKSWSLSKAGIGIEAGLSSQIGFTWYTPAFNLFKKKSLSMKVLFFLSVFASLVTSSVLSNIAKNRYDITHYSLKHMARLLRESIDKKEIKYLILFLIDTLSTLLWMLLFFVVFT